jgi:uncharacterized protein
MFMRPVDHAVAAVLSGDDARLSELLAADPQLATARNMFGVSPLHAAHAIGRSELAAQLRGDGPSGPEGAVDALVLASELGDLDLVADLVAAVPDRVNEHDGRGATALHGACYWGRAAVVEHLLAVGADANATTRDEFLRIPALGSAIATTPGVPQPSDAEDVVLRIVRALLERWADPNRPRLDGMTALHSAAWRGLERVVQELLDAGADRTVSATQGMHAGQTAADTALSQGHLVLASRLDGGAADIASAYG